MYSVGIMLLCFFSVMFVEIFCIQLQQTPRKCCRKSGETLISLKEFLKYSYIYCLFPHIACSLNSKATNWFILTRISTLSVFSFIDLEQFSFFHLHILLVFCIFTRRGGGL